MTIAHSPTEAAPAGVCPVPHTAYSHQKTAKPGPAPAGAVEKIADGQWRINGFAEARAILRGDSTQQAGFNAELIRQVSMSGNLPILYQEGREHLQQRKQTARFFTPKTTSENYRDLMVRQAERNLAVLRGAGRADLARLTMDMAVRVAAEVVGLTESRLPGMSDRLNAFFVTDPTQFSWRPDKLIKFALAQVRVAQFFFLDVQPAIAARRRAPREDVISHLIGLKYSDADILTECITYAAAGMATTREFICVAAWHFLEHPDLKAEYLAAPEERRQDLLEEILRLEPVVGHLYRRVTAPIELDTAEGHVTIPAGDLLDLNINAVNVDTSVAPEAPLSICPGREFAIEGVNPPVMGFGDGHHRCPGAYVAIQESDLFLTRLLAMPNLAIERPPTVTWSHLTAGYELRNFILRLN